MPAFVLPEDTANVEPREEAATTAYESEQPMRGTAALAAGQVAAQGASHATAAAEEACSEQQAVAAPSAEEPVEISATEAAAKATAGAAASGSPSASSSMHSEPDEQLLPPETSAAEAGTGALLFCASDNRSVPDVGTV